MSTVLRIELKTGEHLTAPMAEVVVCQDTGRHCANWVLRRPDGTTNASYFLVVGPADIRNLEYVKG